MKEKDPSASVWVVSGPIGDKVLMGTKRIVEPPIPGSPVSRRPLSLSSR